MFILGTVCCRAGSKGVIDKNIRHLAGKPLCTYTFELLPHVKMLSDILVSTDSVIIKQIAKEYGIANILHRPEALATDGASKWDVFIHAVEAYEKMHQQEVDYIADMDVTAPLKIADDINGAISMAIANADADVIITAYEAESNPYFNMMEYNSNGFAQLVKPADAAVANRQEAKKVFSLSPAAFVIKKSAVYQYTHWSKANCKLYIIPQERGIDIDTGNEFRYIEYLMSQRRKL